MPQTKIFIKTFMCPTGLGNLNASCRFHRASDNMPADNLCPTCKLVLVKSTQPQDKITMTVMGEEDIEPEIVDRDEKKHRTARLAGIDQAIDMFDKAGEFATTIKREIQRTQQKAYAEADIARKKKEGFFLTTPAEVSAYRAKRKQDIVEAIVKAKTFEDVQ